MANENILFILGIMFITNLIGFLLTGNRNDVWNIHEIIIFVLMIFPMLFFIALRLARVFDDKKGVIK